MPGNRFGVGELWDGIKEAVANAFNTVAQTFTGILKEIASLAKKYLPEINLIFRVVSSLPGLVRAVGDAVKGIPGAIQGAIKGLQSFVQQRIKDVSNLIRQVKKELNISLRTAQRLIEKALREQFNKLPKQFRDTLKNIFDPVRRTIATVEKKITGFPGELNKIRVKLINEFNKIKTGIEKTVRSKIDELGKVLKKEIQGTSKGFANALKPLLEPIKQAIKNVINEIKAVRQSVVRDLETKTKLLLQPAENAVKSLGSAVKQQVETVSKNLGNTAREQLNNAKGFVKEAEKRLDDVIKNGSKTVSSKVDEVGKAANKTATALSDLPRKVVAEVVEEVPKRLRPVFQSVEIAVKAPIVVVQKTVDNVGKEVGRIGQSVGNEVGKVGQQVGKVADDVGRMGKEISKIARFADDAGKIVLKLGDAITPLLKIAANAAPIIDGFADYFQFQELNDKLDKIIKAGEAEERNQQLRDIEIAQIKRYLREGPGVNSTAGNAQSLQPVLTKLDQLIALVGTSRAGTDNAAISQSIQALRGDIATLSSKPIQAQVNTEAVAAAVAAKVPKPAPAPTPEAIANAVAAKIPKATPAPTPEAIANAVAAKVPKPATARDVAAEVQTKLQPALKTIDGKLPDNGIFRVDQTGIANAVQGKLAQGQAKTDGAILEVLRQAEQIKLSNSTQTQTITQAITAAKAPNNVATVEHLNQLLNLTNNHTTNQVSRIQNTVNDIKISVPPSPGVDLSPLETQLKDIGAALGVPQLKAGLSVTPNAKFVELGQQTANGSSSLTANSLPQLMMGLAAIPYVRQGLHRLGGQFDQSVMRPSAGKVQINDALSFQAWQFAQVDERLGMPSEIQMVGKTGAMQKQQFRNVQDTIEEINAVTVTSAQDLEVIERYLFALTQDMQKIMQIALQTREDVDVVIEDLGCKYTEIKKSHPTHINLTQGTPQSSLEKLFENGRVHYVGRKWADSADKNQKLERLSYDTQIAAMSNKFDFDKQNPELPLDKSRATGSQRSDETWRTFVNTMTEPPTGYVAPGNPIPEIKEITTGTPKEVPKPTNPAKKLGQ
jgi:hypothetical protein